MPTGIELITDERERQIVDLGYTVEHDAEHDDADLAFAAAVYAAPTTINIVRIVNEPVHEGHGAGGYLQWVEPWPRGWPRSDSPTNNEERIRELTKAGALIAAEIDRLIAQEATSNG